MRVPFSFYVIGIILMSGCSNLSVLDSKGTAADSELKLLYLSIALMVIVLLVVFSLFIRFLIKYRERPGQENDFPTQIEGNKKLETTWIVLPFVILFILAVPTFATTYQLDNKAESMDEPLVINVTGKQFSWVFYYPEFEITLENEVKLPVDRPVIFNLHSEDVIHSFWIPQLAGKKDVLPHKENQLTLTPLETGTYDGKCAEFCGASHAFMTFETTVVEQETFKQWTNVADKQED
ncbi:cytochrome c oxidase subunit II [Guptibacillus spartinae]|uniref:cytochrome c oxidase subunit II n=1 Tax=Guptibacillus spartinae TaxID=3025679 RepID=UPI0023627E2F|nr:cytochrome c oxidase subunit II [Pseudalkalibacillus spartinae]